MVHAEPLSPAGDLHQVSLSPSTGPRSSFKFDGPHKSIKVPDDSASRNNWRPALIIGFLLFAAAIAQVVLAFGIRQNEIHVGVLFEDEGYSPAAGNPAIGLLALGVEACFIALSVLDKKKSRGKWVKVVKLTTTIYSSIAFGVMAFFSFVELAVYKELSSYERCVVDVGADSGESDECICSRGDQSDNAKVDIASDADITCDHLPDYADNVLASFVLMAIILVLAVAGIWCKPCARNPKITSITLEANPTPYVVSHTSPTREWGRRQAYT